MAEALQQLARGDTIIGGDGGIPPVIETKSMGTAPTEGNTEYSSLLAQSKRQSTALQALESTIRDLTAAAAGGGGGGGGQRRPNSNKNPPG